MRDVPKFMGPGAAELKSRERKWLQTHNETHLTEHRNHKRNLLDDASLTKMDGITKIAPKASGLLKVVHSFNMDSMVQTGLHTLIARAYDP